MKKSSLGRRSSIISQGRISNVDKNSRMSYADGKKSFIPKPTFSAKAERASSIERDSVMSSSKKEPYGSGLRRSKSFLDLGRSSTPCQTPMQFNRRNTSGSCRTVEGRPSSVGGQKSARKEIRPVSEKSFQLQSQQKVNQYFLNHSPELLDKGSIKPMTSGMFADLVNSLISKFDKRIIINRGNFVDEIPNLCKLYNYKGKAEKSWLMTVNAPHSWPYVVAFLVWLVELVEVLEAYNVFEAMYPEKIEEDGEINDIEFKLLVPHMLKGYQLQDDREEMRQFIAKHKMALDVSEDTVERLQKEYNELQKELNDSEDTMEEEQFQEKKVLYEDLKSNIKKTREFIYGTENYVANMTEKRTEKLQRFEEYEKIMVNLKQQQEELDKIVSSQEMSAEYKKEIEKTLALLQRDIRQLQEQITDYQNEVYKEDIQLVNVKKQYDKMIQTYNKGIVVNLVELPELQSVYIDESKIQLMDASDGLNRLEDVDKNIKEMKMELKQKKRNSEVEEENGKRDLGKAEFQYTGFQEEYDKARAQNDELESDISRTKKSFNKDKERMQGELTQIQQKIKLAKERSEFENVTLENELTEVEKKYNAKKEDYDEYAKAAIEILNKQKQVFRDFKDNLEEMKIRKLNETRQKMKAFL